MNETPLTLTIEAKGEIISSNFPAFAEMVREHLATFNRSLSSDDDFDQADKDAKAIAAAESTLKAAKEKALADAVELNNLFEQIDGLTGELASARLDLTRQIAKRKEEVKTELVEESLGQIEADPMDARRIYHKQLQEAMKGKRTVQSIKTALAQCVHFINVDINHNRIAIATFESAHGPDLTMDRRELETKSCEYVQGELRRRFEAKKAHDERKRLEAEAAQARKEAEEAKAAPMKGMLPPDTLPKPPKVDVIPVGRPAELAPTRLPEPITGLTEEQEWERWLHRCQSAFKELRFAREQLQHEANKERASILSQAVNAGWKQMNAANP